MISLIDIFALVFGAFLVLRSAKEGTLKAFLDVVLVCASIFISSYISESVVSYRASMDYADRFGYVIAFVALWFISYFLLQFLVSILLKLVQVTFMGPVDVVGAILFGIIKAVFIIALILRLCVLAPFDGGFRESINNSYVQKFSIPLLQTSYQYCFQKLPSIKFFLDNSADPQPENKENLMDKIPEDVKKIPENLVKQAEQIKKNL